MCATCERYVLRNASSSAMAYIYIVEIITTILLFISPLSTPLRGVPHRAADNLPMFLLGGQSARVGEGDGGKGEIWRAFDSISIIKGGGNETRGWERAAEERASSE